MERIRAVAIERGLSFNELSEQIGKGLIPLGAEESKALLIHGMNQLFALVTKLTLKRTHSNWEMLNSYPNSATPKVTNSLVRKRRIHSKKLSINSLPKVLLIESNN